MDPQSPRLTKLLQSAAPISRKCCGITGDERKRLADFVILLITIDKRLKRAKRTKTKRSCTKNKARIPWATFCPMYSVWQKYHYDVSYAPLFPVNSV